MSSQNGDWLAKSIKYFRALGFFAGYPALSDNELAPQLEQAAKQRHGVIDPHNELADLILLSLDDQRVWWDDTEADVCAENLVYEQTLRQWAAISRGAFAPENIREAWAGEQGPVEIAFQLQGRSQILRPTYQDDYIDLNILSPINEMIARSKIQFAVHAIFDQTAFVVALTQDEKKKLTRDRGWRFAI